MENRHYNQKSGEIIENIRKAHSKKRLTLFVGASLSYLSKSRKWDDLVHDMANEMGKSITDNIGYDELTKIPLMFKNYMGDDHERYIKFVSDSLGIHNLTPNICHLLIMSIAPTKIITTNFDDLFEAAASDALLTYKTVAKDEDIDGIDGSSLILKVHGDINNKNIVLTNTDYLDYENNFKLISTILKASFATDLILIIGYSLRDENIKRILIDTSKVLKSELRKPYFIHIEDTEIEKSDYDYYQSLGVEIIDYKVFCDKKDTYEEKVKEVLRAISKLCTSKNLGLFKQDDDSIDFLYKRLQPLDDFAALRIKDVVETLRPHVTYDGGTIISVRKADDDIFKVFHELHNSPELHNHEETFRKIKLIKRVLQKACIYGYYYEKLSTFNFDKNFQSGNAYSYVDFYEFDKVIGNEETEIMLKLKKGYYLCKLEEYERAIEVFESIASQSFSEKKYAYFLIAQSNRKYAYKLGSIYFSKEYINKEKNQLWYDYFSNHSTQLLESLPLQEQEKYKSMFDFGNNEIYKLSSEVYLLAQKLIDDTGKNTVYFGESTFDKISRKIIEIERYAKENYLIDDSFKEHHDIIRNSITSLLIRYTSKNFKRVREGFFDGLSMPVSNETFSDLHFHFMVNYLKKDDITSIHQINSFTEIEFENIDHIDEYILRFIRPVTDDFFLSKYPRLLRAIGPKISILLILLRFIDIKESTLIILLNELFKKESFYFDISYIVLLIDKQKSIFNKVSLNVQKVLARKLCKFIDEDIYCLESGTKLNMNTRYGYPYYHLIDYIEEPSTLSEYGFRDKVESLFELVDQSCINRVLHLADKTDIELKQKINNRLIMLANEENVFELVLNMCTYEYDCSRLNKLFIDHLRVYIASERTRKLQENTSPKDVRYSKLLQATRYYLGGALQNISLTEFTGLNDQIDFMIDPEQFNYSLFQVEWIFSSSKHELESLANLNNVSKSIKQKIINSLMTNNYNSHDELRLYEILNKYFSR